MPDPEPKRPDPRPDPEPKRPDARPDPEPKRPDAGPDPTPDPKTPDTRPDQVATQDRLRLRRTFDAAADRYDRARPDYPDRLVDDLVLLADLHPGDRLLEVGCGTGKASAPLARRGFRLTCLELGEQLAAVARRNLAKFPDVTVINASYDEWRPSDGAATRSAVPEGTATSGTFDLVFAATSWHWLDPATRYRRAWELLRPGGHLAFWGAVHVFPDGGDPFFRDIQQVYDDIGEGSESDVLRPRPGELPDDAADIEATGLFDDVQTRQYDWEIRYDADAYIALLDTFSGHLEMTPDNRAYLYDAIRTRLATRQDHILRRHWGSILQVARRRP
jgi:SAM-dependent methyltransferase